MSKIINVIKFVLAALLINAFFYFFVTEPGYMIVYNKVLEYSQQKIDITDNDYSEYNYLDKVLKKNMLFFVEEIPGLSLNYDVMLNNIKYFKQNTDIKYIIADVSYTAGELLNICLNDYDTEKLTSIIGTYDDYYINSEDFIAFFKSLAEYNDTLEPKNKLRIIGIAPENNSKLTKEYIEYIFSQLSSKKKPQEINRVYGMPRNDEELYFKTMLDSLNNNDTLYREYFADKYFNIKTALNNCFADSHNDFDDADEIKAQNFLSVFQHNVRSKYYGQLADTSFIEALRDNSEDLSNKIYVDYLVYDNCNFGENESDSDKVYNFHFSDKGTECVTILNNTYMKYFEMYREFVYKINGLEFNGYNTDISNHMIVLSESERVSKNDSN